MLLSFKTRIPSAFTSNETTAYSGTESKSDPKLNTIGSHRPQQSFMRIARLAIRHVTARGFWTPVIVISIAITITLFSLLLPISNNLAAISAVYAKYSSGFIILGSDEKAHGEFLEQLNHYFTDKDVESIRTTYDLKNIFRMMEALVSTKVKAAELPPEALAGLKIPNVDEVYLTLSLVGLDVETASEGNIPFASIIEGEFLVSGRSGTAVISSDAGKLLRVGLGDNVTLLLRRAGVEEKYSFGVVGVFTPPILLTSYPYVVVDINDAFKVLNISDTSKAKYTTLWIKPNDLDAVPTIVRGLRQEYTFAQVFYDRDLVKAALDVLRTTSSTYVQVSYLTLGSSTALVVLLKLLETWRHKREIGLLRSTGWTSNHVLAFIVWQAMYIGLISGAISVVLTLLFGNLAGTFLVPQLSSRIITTSNITPVDTSFMAVSPLMAVSLSVVASLIGALYALRLTPLQALERA